MYEIRISRATTTDVLKIAPVFDLYRQFYEKSSDVQAAETFLNARLNANESIIFFAHDDDEVFGFTQLYPLFSSTNIQRELLLNDLFVVSSARRRGVAKRLMDAARDYARETGSRGLTLETAIDNVQAQALYEQLGYQRDTEHYHYYLQLDS